MSNERILHDKSSVEWLVDCTNAKPNKYEQNKSSTKSMINDTDLSFPVEERSEAEQIVLECRVTDYLQQQVDRYNSKLKNFQLRLEME
ncbi:MAG: hypothetical protein WA364_15990 [Candidatus Nitrosopolaris sp.]